jgi:hypothetical protein
MKARDAAVLGAALMVDDFVATSVFSLMNDLIVRLAGLPFAPQLAWWTGDNQWLGAGLAICFWRRCFLWSCARHSAAQPGCSP